MRAIRVCVGAKPISTILVGKQTKNTNKTCFARIPPTPRANVTMLAGDVYGVTFGDGFALFFASEIVRA